MADRLDRKELRRPDEFQLVAASVLEWMIARKRPIALGAVVLAAAIAAAWGVTAYTSSREAKAGALLAEALEIQSRPIAGEAAKPGLEPFPNQEERQKAALAALQSVRESYPKAAAAQTALAQLGFLKLKMGDAVGAAQALRGFFDVGAKDHPLRAFAIESLGYALEAQGRLPEAEKAFAQLAAAQAPERAALHKARLALMTGKPEARSELEQVAKAYPKDPVALEANLRLELSELPPATPSAAQPAPVEPSKASRKK